MQEIAGELTALTRSLYGCAPEVEYRPKAQTFTDDLRKKKTISDLPGLWTYRKSIKKIVGVVEDIIFRRASMM